MTRLVKSDKFNFVHASQRNVTIQTKSHAVATETYELILGSFFACSVSNVEQVIRKYTQNTICYNTLKSYLATDHTCGRL